MSNPSGFSQSYASLFVQLAELAQQDLSQIILPAGWSQVVNVTSDRSVRPPIPNAQGFYARGILDGSASSAVLVLGVTWSEFLNTYNVGGGAQDAETGVLQTLAPTGVIGSDFTPQLPVLVAYQFGGLYGQIRASIWNGLKQVQSMPLYVVGIGMGGMLAQLAVLDLRPGNKGPANQPAPTAAPVCYVFSAPPVGNSSFAQYYRQKVAQSYTVWAGTSDLPVDLFPTAPPEYQSSGQLQSLSALLPSSYDDPWVERSGDFYLTTLGGTPMPPPTSPGSIVNPPAGFDRFLAFSLAKLCAVAYQRKQHPNAQTGLDISPFVPQADITSTDITSKTVTFCSLFTSPDSVVVAFPGAVTWQELVLQMANNNLDYPDFLGQNFAYVLQGALQVYKASSTGKAGEQTFRQAVIAKVQQLAGTPAKKVYVTGHSLGGVLASICAADLKVNYAALAPAKLYTFGCLPVGNYEFAQFFNPLFAGNSFHIARTGDFAPNLWPILGFEPLNQQVTLQGTPPSDDFTQHPISGYARLLNPSPQAAGDFLSLKMKGFGLSTESVHEGELKADENREILLSHDARESAIKPVCVDENKGDLLFASSQIVVGEDESLVVRPGTANADIVIDTLVVRQGGVVRIEGSATLHIQNLRGESALAAKSQAAASTQNEMHFNVRGMPGTQGMPGAIGGSGAPGSGPGGRGGMGGLGGDGSNSPDVILNLGNIDGTAIFYMGGGDGGPGGSGGPGGEGGTNMSGGPGGQGGSGGDGGRGGNAGDGGTVTVNYQSLSPGSSFQIATYIGEGGLGGPGGTGGPGGRGNPPGQPGLRGRGGASGTVGKPSKLILMGPQTPAT
ncbi:MAG TPA: hypothetical protein VGC66_23235 [Pyrinomonadaceae bacterium]|jgi:hypothetical protein